MQWSGMIENEGYVLYGFDQIGGVDDCVVVGLFGEQLVYWWEVVFDQQ